MKFPTSIIKIIEQRQSKRDYRNEPLTKEHIQIIESALKENDCGPFQNSITFKLIEKQIAQNDHKIKIGTYGFISGARYFIAGSVDLSKPFVLEDYGYLLEKVILQLTELGIATCWLGGTFNRNNFSILLGNDHQLVVPAITPVGYPKQSKSIRESIIRFGAKSDQRKPWEELFFFQGFECPLSENDAGDYRLPIEMLRKSPSASNKQPWRLVKTDNAIHFYLLETPGYDKMIKSVKLQRIDMGIAMSHFELTCKELKLNGRWEVIQTQNTYGEAKYLVSWVMAT